MHTKKHFWALSISGILLLSLGIFAFRTAEVTNEEVDKELMTLTAVCTERGKVVKAFVSVNGKDFSEQSFVTDDAAPQGNFDFNPVLTLIKEYQEGGWKVISNNMSIQNQALSNPRIYNYFLLERDTPVFKKK